MRISRISSPGWRIPRTRAQATAGKASGMIGDLCIDDKGQMHCPIRTLAILKQLTRNTFDSPQQWVQWWHDNRGNVVLSEDGRTLVTKLE